MRLMRFWKRKHKFDKLAMARCRAAQERNKELAELKHRVKLKELRLKLAKVEDETREYLELDEEEYEEQQPEEGIEQTLLKGILGGIAQNVSERTKRTKKSVNNDEQVLDSDIPSTERNQREEDLKDEIRNRTTV